MYHDRPSKLLSQPGKSRSAVGVGAADHLQLGAGLLRASFLLPNEGVHALTPNAM